MKFFLVLGIVSLILTCSLSPQSVFASAISENKLIELTNTERIKNNLPSLALDPLLSVAAHNKAQDMISKHYFDHYSPGNQTPWNFMQNVGYYYLIAGENLAMDFRTSEGVHNAWMASPSHRANILNKNYEDIAIAAEQGEIDNHQTTLVVQMFAKKDSTVFGQVNYLVSKISGFILGHSTQNF